MIPHHKGGAVRLVFNFAFVELDNAVKDGRFGNDVRCEVRCNVMRGDNFRIVCKRFRNCFLSEFKRDFRACFQTFRDSEVQDRDRLFLADHYAFRSQTDAELSLHRVIDRRRVEKILVLLHCDEGDLLRIKGQIEGQGNERILDRSGQQHIDRQEVLVVNPFQVFVHFAALDHHREVLAFRTCGRDERKHHHERKEHCQQFLHRFYPPAK